MFKSKTRQQFFKMNIAPPKNIAPSIPTPAISEKQEPKSKWGPPTWLLLHTIAEKVKEQQFSQIREELINIIQLICGNLPCPICTDHSKKYLSGINFNTIQTKQQLKDMLFHFHNTVNQRKDYPLYSYNQLNVYNVAVTNNIIHNFFYHFKNHSYNIRLISENLQRTRIVENLKLWFQKNIIYFDQ